MKRIIACIAAIILTSQVAFAQSDVNEFINKSLDAYGSWNSIETFEYKVEGERSGGTQAKTYKGNARQSYNSKRIYNLPERKLFEVNINYFPGGYVFKFATFVNDTSIFQYDMLSSRTGKVYKSGGKEPADGRLSAGNNHIAYLKVKELLKFEDELTLIDSEINEFVIIRRNNEKGEFVADYFFSREDQLLKKIKEITQEMVISQYKNNEGRVDNGYVALYANGDLIYEEMITVTDTGFTFDSALLEVPEGYVKAESKPSSGPIEIANDIYLIENLAGDRNVLFVNMDEYIVVIEAPISSDLSKQVISMIKEVAPEKPIKYVFSTHYHNDHTGGLRQYVHEGAELVMGGHTQEYVKELIMADRPDDLGAGGEAKFSIINNVMSLSDENHKIEFYEIPNSHADGMAFVYFPEEKIIYQGDLLSVPKDGTITTPIEVTKEMVEFLKSNKLEFERMIGHHGHNYITQELLDKIMENPN